MYQQIAANKRKSLALILGFVIFITGLSWLFALYSGRPSITIAVLIGATVYAIITYFAAAKLAVALNGAHKIEKRDNPRLYRIIENIAITNGMPMPKVYVMDDPAPNAFATGRDPNHALVAATTGLLNVMDDTELEGVIAHELGHVKNYDIRVSMVAFALAAVVGILADIMLRMAWFGGNRNNRDSGSSYLFILAIIAAILAPIVAILIQMAISRKREYLADATGALTTRYPEGLARALEKIKIHGSATKRPNTTTAHLFFANPLNKREFTTLFSTHPPIEDRIKRLRSMGTHI